MGGQLGSLFPAAAVLRLSKDDRAPASIVSAFSIASVNAMDPAASRRVGLLAGHLTCEPSPGGALQQSSTAAPAAGPCPNCGCSSQGAAGPSSSSYATATGRPTSYARVHGEASRAPAVWRRIESVQRERLEDVKYEKAVGEGIAKVGPSQECAGCCRVHCAVPGSWQQHPTASISGPKVSCCPLQHAYVQHPRLQITINRPHRRNAFTPRTSERCGRGQH